MRHLSPQQYASPLLAIATSVTPTFQDLFLRARVGWLCSVAVAATAQAVAAEVALVAELVLADWVLPAEQVLLDEPVQ